MKVAFWCGMMLCGLLCALGVVVLFEVEAPLAIRGAASAVSVAAGVGFGSLLLEVMKEDDDG